jgi:hypothetical protein
MQSGLNTAAMVLPTVDADLGVHIRRLAQAPDSKPMPTSAETPAAVLLAHIKAFLGSR